LFLSLAPIFFILSMHSSGTPIFVPGLWPNSFYNTRYALAVVMLAAFAAGAIVTLLEIFRPKSPGAILVAILCGLAPLVFWISHRPVCLEEAEHNSVARRDWTRQTAEFLKVHYRHGSGILFSFGDLTGALRQAGIPLREGLHSGNGPAWNAAVVRPDLFLREEWALAFAGDEVASAARRAHYRLRKQIATTGAIIEIYQRP